MNHYLDKKFFNDSETTVQTIVNTYFQFLHKTLAEEPFLRIGVSFPDYDKDRLTLGSRLRLHGNERALQVVQEKKWLINLQDHLLISEIRVVPATHKNCTVRRVQIKSNVDRLRRRLINRHDLTEDEAILRIPNFVEKKLELPYINIRSASTGQMFRLFISQAFVNISLVNEDFNAYGFSKSSTLPFF